MDQQLWHKAAWQDGYSQLHKYLDPSNLNQGTVTEPFIYILPKDHFTKLLQTKIFTIVDFCRGFYHIEPDEDKQFVQNISPHLDVSGLLECQLAGLW